MARHLAPARLTFACVPEVSPPNEELGVLKRLHRESSQLRTVLFPKKLKRVGSCRTLSEREPGGMACLRQ
jgi:hypothetical protein